VIYTSSNTNVAAIVNGKIHIVGAGMTNITATVAANSNYTSTPAITQTLVVNKASQTIAFAAISNQMKGSQYSLSSVTASSGLPVTLSSSDPVIASVSGFALTSNRLGRVSIMATQPGDNNYLPAAAVTQTFDVVDAAGNEVLIRKAVSPNGDGINDFLYIEGVNEHPNNAVTIINRNGVKVFEIKNYDNSSKVFDGHSNVTGAMQQAGTYFYLLEYTVDGVGRRQTGWFVLKY
jgi:gliding motility-associated-like protein